MYVKDFDERGSVGGAYIPATGTIPSENGYFGNLAPVAESDNGFLIVKTGSSGSYDENDINSGNYILDNNQLGILTEDTKSAGTYTKKNNNNGEYEVI
jgi:hypothetical protein